MNVLSKSAGAALEEIRKANPVVYEAMLLGRIEPSVLTTVRKILEDCGFSPWFYQTMERSVLKGNFDVLYLDARVVGDDPKRLKAQKELARIRKGCNELKAKGVPLDSILSFD